VLIAAPVGFCVTRCDYLTRQLIRQAEGGPILAKSEGRGYGCLIPLANIGERLKPIRLLTRQLEMDSAPVRPMQNRRADMKHVAAGVFGPGNPIGIGGIWPRPEARSTAEGVVERSRDGSDCRVCVDLWSYIRPHDARARR
jgi:hypothetical protein